MEEKAAKGAGVNYKDLSEAALERIRSKLKNVPVNDSARIYTEVTMQLRAYSGMAFQAAIQYADKVGKDEKHKAKIITICPDVASVGITAAVASHFPPALAVIPAALTFVSTHVVPFFVPKTDFRTPFLHLRAASKAGVMNKITMPSGGNPSSISLMQERQFYNEMFFRNGTSSPMQPPKNRRPAGLFSIALGWLHSHAPDLGKTHLRHEYMPLQPLL